MSETNAASRLINVVEQHGRATRDFRPPGGRMRLYAVDLNALYLEHNEALTRYLTRLTGDRDSAADAAQEAYARLLSHPPAHDDNLRAWLYTVATNVVRDGWKKQQTALRLVQNQDGVPTAAAPPDPHEIVERTERQQAVLKVLEHLSERDRVTLLMREEGFTHKEIAVTIGTTTKSVGTVIARALRKFSREFEAAGTLI